jgi:hypothetical protein
MSPARFRCATQLVSVQSTLQLIDGDFSCFTIYIPHTNCHDILRHGEQPLHVRDRSCENHQLTSSSTSDIKPFTYKHISLKRNK